jgi:hypothetical protein
MTPFPSQHSIRSAIGGHFRVHPSSSCETADAPCSRVPYSNMQKRVLQTPFKIEMPISGKEKALPIKRETLPCVSITSSLVKRGGIFYWRNYYISVLIVKIMSDSLVNSFILFILFNY